MAMNAAMVSKLRCEGCCAGVAAACNQKAVVKNDDAGGGISLRGRNKCKAAAARMQRVGSEGSGG